MRTCMLTLSWLFYFIFKNRTSDLHGPNFFQAYLCHESCQENGSIIESAAGWAGRCTIVRANGSLLRRRPEDDVSIENVRDNWSIIRDISNAQRLESIQDATGALMSSLDGLRSGTDGVGGEESDVFQFCNKDTILYALGGKNTRTG